MKYGIIRSMKIFKSKQFITPLGKMLAVADDCSLLLLEFVHDNAVKCERLPGEIVLGDNPVLEKISIEIAAWFAGKITQFTTPVKFTGTLFQQRVWQALMQIPFGTTISYAELARRVCGKVSACRAVANANGANLLTIIVPCHRVIQSNGGIGGYSGGVHYKQWLLKHEQQG